MNVRTLAERFVWGLSRPVRLLLALRQNKPAFHAAMKSALLQAFATLALAAAVVAYRADELVDSTRSAVDRIGQKRFTFSSSQAPQASPTTPPAEDEVASRAADNAMAEAVTSLEEQLQNSTDEGQHKGFQVALRELKSQLQAGSESRAAGRPPTPQAPEVPAWGAETWASETEATEGLAENGEDDAKPSDGLTGPPVESIEAKIRRLSAERAKAKTPAQKASVRQALSEARRELKRSVKGGVVEDAEGEPGEPDPEADDEEEKLPVWRRFWALAVSALFAAQWVVLALARDYQDRTSRELALIAAIEPEEDDIAPRVRVDWKWLRRKLRRRIRGVMVLIPGFVLASPVFLLARVLHFSWLSSVLTGAWTFYWWMVFSAARTGRAWLWENSAPPNAPLRWYLKVTQTVPGMRWWGPRFVAWLWVRMTRSMFSPALAVELDVGAFAGLSLARLIGNVPLIRVFVRPAMSVVAAEIVIQKAVAAAPFLTAATMEAVIDPPQRAKENAGVV